jgi:predicted DNA-binding mobile mystery protein A
MKSNFKDLERRQLIKRFDSLLSMTPGFTKPPEGWVRTTRKALGITMSQLAKRLGVRQSRIAEIEKTEIQDHLTLKTLKATAQAMGCRFEYAFIPEEPLEVLLKKRALKIAQAKVDYISHQMALENQELSSEEKASQVKQLAEELLKKPQKLWEE